VSERRDGWGIATAALLTLACAAGLIYTFLVEPTIVERARIDAYNRGLADGIAEGMASAATSPADPDVSLLRQLDEMRSELETAATCEGRLIDYQRTEAANRENARAWGWNDGYAQGRTDWRVQPECP
jgi:flagellar biosynthesis/type III secretory pathway protein FliH